MKGFVYAFRYGDGDHVKIGRTINIERRLRELQGAHHHRLELVELLEHDDYQEGEKYIHKLLGPWRVREAAGVSREHFLVPDAELEEAFRDTRRYLDQDVPRERKLRKLETLKASDDILPATPEMLEAGVRSAELRVELDQLNAELRHLDDEEHRLRDQILRQQEPERERLNREIRIRTAEYSELENTVKLAIGPAAGIAGLATWKSEEGRRRFDAEWVKTDDPDLFDSYRTAFDASRFKKEQRSVYEAHMRVTTHRAFAWMSE